MKRVLTLLSLGFGLSLYAQDAPKITQSWERTTNITIQYRCVTNGLIEPSMRMVRYNLQYNPDYYKQEHVLTVTSNLISTTVFNNTTNRQGLLSLPVSITTNTYTWKKD